MSALDLEAIKRSVAGMAVKPLWVPELVAELEAERSKLPTELVTLLLEAKRTALLFQAADLGDGPYSEEQSLKLSAACDAYSRAQVRAEIGVRRWCFPRPLEGVES